MKNVAYLRKLLLTTDMRGGGSVIDPHDVKALDGLFNQLCDTSPVGAVTIVSRFAVSTHSEMARIGFEALRYGFPDVIGAFARSADDLYRNVSGGSTKLRLVILTALFKSGIPIENPLVTDAAADEGYDSVFVPALKDILAKGHLSLKEKEELELLPFKKDLLDAAFWYMVAGQKLSCNRSRRIARMLRDLHAESEKRDIMAFRPDRPYTEGVVKVLAGGVVSAAYVKDGLKLIADNQGKL